MKNERKQLEIIKNQLLKAQEIVWTQKLRYEELQTQIHQYPWTLEGDGINDEIAIGISGAIGSLEEAIENINIYNY